MDFLAPFCEAPFQNQMINTAEEAARQEKLRLRRIRRPVDDDDTCFLRRPAPNTITREVLFSQQR